MAQYDLVITQNTSVAGIDFEEKVVNLTRGGLLTATADVNRAPRILAAGTEGQVLSVDANGDLVFVSLAAGHTQNTDTGTIGNTFTIDSDSSTGKIVIDVALNAGEDRTMTLTNAVMTGDVTLTLPAVTGTLATQAYADGLFASNDAMLYKGTIGSGGTHTIAAFNALTTYNAGWTYRIIEAGTVRSVVCEIGDLVTVLVDRAGSGNLDSDFTVVQTNLDGAVIGPASTTDNYVALFSGTTGKLLKAGSGALGTMAYETATNYVPKSLATEQGSVFYASAANTLVELLHGDAGQVLQSGGHAANPSWLTLGTMAAAATSDYVAKALYDANSILYATADNTPAALTVGASTIVGRKASGDISAMSAAEVRAILITAAPAAKTSTGVAGAYAYDSNYYYQCVATDTWRRAPLAQWT